jgi:ribosomal protein L32
MAVPKKKTSRSRRDMRRYSCAYKPEPVSETICEFTGSVVRTHTVSMKAIKSGLYDAAATRKAKKEAKSAQA